MYDALSPVLLRNWCDLAFQRLAAAREEIDALNVYPVPDGDTGTNLLLTQEAVVSALESLAPDAAPHEVAAAVARSSLMGARGNSGTILAQLLRGMAQVLAADGDAADADGRGLRLALRRAAESAYEAVAKISFPGMFYRKDIADKALKSEGTKT